ncbi:MAG: ABC transporter substrate-binding protein [Betaproteobacteria bacterium]|nr:MAG: ABC transporter substrate-binding protein [Betaproteobacteria bacterium]
MKRLGMLLSSLVVAGTLATSSAEAQQVTLDVLYAFPAFAKFHEPIAQEFMKLHPDIKIAFRAPAPTYDDGHQTMMRQAVTNQLPDVYYSGFHLLSELARTLAKRNQIVDLDPLLAADGKEFRAKNYSDRIVALGRVDGKLYGLPFNASSPIMYYNVELVKKAGGDPEKMPDNWDAVIALAAKIKAGSSDVAGLAYNVHDWPDVWLYHAMITQAGGTVVDGDRVPLGGPDIGVQMLQRFRRFVSEDGMPLIDWDQSRQQFIAGKIGIFFDTPARLRQVTDLIGDKFTLKTAIFPIDNKAKGGLPTGGNAAIITTQDPKKQKAAWEFLKFVTGPEAQKIVVETTGYLPTNLRATGPEFLGPFYDKNPNFRTVSLQVDRSVPWQGYPGGNSVRIWRAQREIITGIMRGEIEPKAGYERLIKETADLMKSQ